MAMMNAAIIVFECPGSRPCMAPSRIAVGIKIQRLVLPFCRDWKKSGIIAENTAHADLDAILKGL